MPTCWSSLEGTFSLCQTCARSITAGSPQMEGSHLFLVACLFYCLLFEQHSGVFSSMEYSNNYCPHLIIIAKELKSIASQSI